MKPAARRGIWVAVLLTTGCWSTNFAQEEQLSPPDRPLVGDREQLSSNGGPTEQEDFFLQLLPGPLVISIKSTPASRQLSDRAVVRVDLPVGFAGQPAGLAELASMAVTDTRDESVDARTLRQVIRALGGELKVIVGANWTSLTATLPVADWAPALTAITDRLVSLPLSRSQLDELQRQLVLQYLEGWSTSPLLSQVSQTLRHANLPRESILESIEDHSLPDVAKFRREYYGPHGVSVGLSIPGADPAALTARSVAALRAWGEGAEDQPDWKMTTEVTESPEGVQWYEGEGTSQVAIIVPISTASLSHLALLDSLTMGGIGGRIGTAMTRELGFEPLFAVHGLGSHDERFMVLATQADPEAVQRIWRAANTAWSSLREQPPAREELANAVQRTRLHLFQRQDRPDQWLESLLLRFVRKQEGSPTRELEQLSQITAGSVRRAAEELVPSDISMVVVGGRAPINLGREFRLLETIVPWTSRATLDAETSEQRAARFMDRAIEALGGSRELEQFAGYDVDESWLDEQGLAATVTTSFQDPDAVQRSTTVLETRILSDVKGATGTESTVDGDRRRKLTAREATDLLEEARRHPVAILAAYAQGKVRFELVGLRTRRGKRVALLESTDEIYNGLRITIDIRSGLLRTVESASRRQGSLISIQETYEDYRRNTAGIRVPMYRVTQIDDKEAGVAITVRSFSILKR